MLSHISLLALIKLRHHQISLKQRSRNIPTGSSEGQCNFKVVAVPECFTKPSCGDQNNQAWTICGASYFVTDYRLFAGFQIILLPTSLICLHLHLFNSCLQGALQNLRLQDCQNLKELILLLSVTHGLKDLDLSGRISCPLRIDTSLALEICCRVCCIPGLASICVGCLQSSWKSCCSPHTA